jgi:hypothetical protein
VTARACRQLIEPAINAARVPGSHTEVRGPRPGQFHQAGLHRSEPLHHRLTEVDEPGIAGEPDRAELRTRVHPAVGPVPFRRRLGGVVEFERRQAPIVRVEVIGVHTGQSNRTSVLAQAIRLAL